MIWMYLRNGFSILVIMDEIYVIYKLVFLFLYIFEFIIIKEEKCFLIKGLGIMVIDIIVIFRYIDRYVLFWFFVFIFICFRYVIF